MTSMSAWVAWRAGMSPAMALSVVAIAGRVDELPASIAAFRRGELSLDQMAAIARPASGWADVQSRDYAIVMTVSQLRYVLQKYPFPVLDDAGREVVADAAANTNATESSDGSELGVPSSVDEFLSMWQDDDGSFRLTGRFDADAGMVVQSALSEVRDRIFQRGELGAGMADALREMAQASLDSIADPARRSRFRVNLFINTNRDDRGMVDAAGWNVPDTIRRYITSDATMTPLFVEHGLPVSVGRAQYVVPARTRTVIEHRDHGVCRVPGCDAGRMDTGQIYFNPPRTYYDGLRQRMRTDSAYLAHIQPPGLHSPSSQGFRLSIHA